MNKPEKAPFKLEINWKISLFSLLLLPVLVGLGFWQLQRADEKSTIQQLLAEQQARPPVTLNAAPLDDSQQWLYRPIRATGRPDAQHLLLLENRIHQGRIGFNLIVPLTMADGGLLLVNCGWLPAPPERGQLPQLPPLPASVTVSGRLVKPSHNPLLRGQQANTQWPRMILQVDIPSMAQSLGQPVSPWLLQLDSDSPMALVVDWQPLNMSAGKHIGYAVQWFLMALALIILAVFANSNLGRRKR